MASYADSIRAILSETPNLTAQEISLESGAELKPIVDAIGRLTREGDLAYTAERPRRYRLATEERGTAPEESPAAESSGVAMAAAGVSEIAQALANRAKVEVAPVLTGKGLEGAYDEAEPEPEAESPPIANPLRAHLMDAADAADEELIAYVYRLGDEGLRRRLALVEHLRDALSQLDALGTGGLEVEF
jgi:hypothetical protein